MLPALAAATTAIDALQLLTAAKKKSATGSATASSKASNPFDVASASTASATSSAKSSTTPTVIS